MPLYHNYVKSPVGYLLIQYDETFLYGIHIIREDEVGENSDFTSDVLRETKRQLVQYFKGKRKDFDLPVKPFGTEFQMKVWEELRKVPYGTTCSYSDLAAGIHQPNAAKAVGKAANRNPLMIVVPCHRVIGKNGKLIGYSGGLKAKEYLLSLERKYGEW